MLYGIWEDSDFQVTTVQHIRKLRHLNGERTLFDGATKPECSQHCIISHSRYPALWNKQCLVKLILFISGFCNNIIILCIHVVWKLVIYCYS